MRWLMRWWRKLRVRRDDVFTRMSVDVSRKVGAEFGIDDRELVGGNPMYFHRWNVTGPLRRQLASCIKAI